MRSVIAALLGEPDRLTEFYAVAVASRRIRAMKPQSRLPGNFTSDQIDLQLKRERQIRVLVILRGRLIITDAQITPQIHALLEAKLSGKCSGCRSCTQGLLLVL